jgi:5'-3' exonuclease
MGVHDLWKIPVANTEHASYDKLLGDVGEKLDLKDLKGHRICIDASDYIYNSLLAMAHVDSLTDAEGRPTAHILRIFSVVQMLHKAGAKQIWVFDSATPNEFKKFEQEKRHARREQGAQKGHEKQAFGITSEIVNDIKSLLTFMGVSFLEAPEGIEAEHYGAYMTSGNPGQRFCTYMLSADSDVLAFGGNLLRHTTEKSASGKTKKTVYRVYEQDDVLSALDVDYEDFLKICVALGTDFQSAKIKGVGPKTVVAKVKNDKLTFDDELVAVMDYMSTDPPTDSADMQENTLDADGLKEFLLAKKFKEDRIDIAIEVMQS